jgi:aminoglycoside phosphotransferase (APT) family kinase protein
MHADQVDVTAATVAALVAEHFPQWRQLPVRRVPSAGTVNALFRVGDDVVVRLPLRPSTGAGLRAELIREQSNARRLAAHAPVAVPEPLGIGAPGDGYPGWWAAYRWIPGELASDRSIADAVAFARDLAGFVDAVRGMDTGGATWNGASRGGPLHTRDADVRAALDRSTHLVDTGRLGRIWDGCLAARPATGDVWIHADLMPGNLLVRDGRLAAVIDLEGMCVGDPAVDLMPAWNLLPGKARPTFRRALGVDDDTWERGRGWAIVQAIVALPYYVDTNPAMADTARHTLAAVTQ